jgi:hypothetical protein
MNKEMVYFIGTLMLMIGNVVFCSLYVWQKHINDKLIIRLKKPSEYKDGIET